MKIAIVQLGRIGDMILMTSAIKPIKQQFPDSEIYFIAGSANHTIVSNNPDVKQVLIYDKNPVNIFKFIFKLKRINFNYYIDPKDHFSSESYFIAKLAKANKKIGFNDAKHSVFDIAISSYEENIDLHFIERLHNTLKYLDISTKPAQPYLHIDKSTIDKIDNFLNINKLQDYTIVNISAGNATRMWKEANWIEFINRTKNYTKYVLISDISQLNIAGKICNATNIIHFPPSPFAEVIALVARAGLLITPDTSLVHVATAFNLPAVVLTCNIPWNIAKFRPLSKENAVVIPEQPEGNVELLSVEEVTAATMRFIVR